jgi:cellulose synthase/poly-beta-1,6-N-acetylglucosamine synthase-like glycosyltransferase
MQELRRQRSDLELLSPEEEQVLFDDAQKSVIEDSNGTIWAAGKVRIGDYILLIDSDTRVPPDCFIDAASELERAPDVGALQHCSGITYVHNHYFERLLGYFVGVFTNFSISWGCSNGAMAPLMGDNVFLRWKALQECSRPHKDGSKITFSPSHVSEDYEMGMRLQMAGYWIRWATYSNQEFKGEQASTFMPLRII